MPISGVFLCQDDTGMMLIESIRQRLQLFLAQVIGQWSMIYKLYTRYSKHLHMMSVEVNGDFEQMIIKAKLWNMRQTLHLEGDMYEVNDFIVRIACTNKGVIVNIEYMACDTIAQGYVTIQSFLTECLIPTFKNACVRSSYNEVAQELLKFRFRSNIFECWKLRNTSLSFFTNYERSMLDYGTKKQRLESESFRLFDACHLCLSQTRDTVSCKENGDIFCRVCIMENLLAQRKEIKKNEEEIEKKKSLDDFEERKIEEIVKMRTIKEFEESQLGFNTPYNDDKHNDEVLQKKEVKDVFKLDKEELLMIAKNDRDRERSRYIKEQQAESKPSIGSFWIPSLTPSVNNKDVLKKQKRVPICPASSSDKPHKISLKSLISVKFTENKLPGSKELLRICPACKKKLSNISGAYIMKSCGHVICTICLDQFVRESGVCYVCESSLYVQNNDVAKNDSKLLIVQLSSEGTGFSAKKDAIAKKVDVAFQGS
ncbi:hypothetical protein MERGE_002981 [Pneumocystis wakefieldiae]|uniref:Mediator of RNA polymerase II transcription subunit 20 n=1 Tax=Pneumocystis wakefieldiae TaxID=38082 RepID=A0A899G2V8_9ASCO|nr:hypothetical protein MERGE_002981 [Pneumocystis wakefieldiae]